MEKGEYLDNIYKEVIKTSDFASVQIQYLSSHVLTLVQEGKINRKLYRNTVTYIVNPGILFESTWNRKSCNEFEGISKEIMGKIW